MQYTMTKESIAAVLTEWDRRWREAPGEFLNIAEHLLFSNPATYGEESAPYFISLHEEMNNSGAFIRG